MLEWWWQRGTCLHYVLAFWEKKKLLKVFFMTGMQKREGKRFTSYRTCLLLLLDYTFMRHLCLIETVKLCFFFFFLGCVCRGIVCVCVCMQGEWGWGPSYSQLCLKWCYIICWLWVNFITIFITTYILYILLCLYCSVLWATG